MNAMIIILNIFITALSLLFVSKFVPGIQVDNFYIAIIASLVLGILHIFVKPILVILTLPVTILTLGLFMFVINAGLLMFAASFIEGFSVDGFITALIASLIVSIISSVSNKVLA